MKSFEKKWQNRWLKEKTFFAKDVSKKPSYYVLDMFPYPSAQGMHVGHLRGYTYSDVFAKKRMMEGYNVLHPMGFDAFGLPAENFAIKTGVHPIITTKNAIKNYTRQMKMTGFGYDWSRQVITCQPEYYKWTQWMFLKLYRAGLCYRKEAPVNFCPSCKTVLAREQVIDGKCERCSAVVGKRNIRQWFFKTTAYAQRLLDDLDFIDWPEKIKLMQRNWIGRSEGVEVLFPVGGEAGRAYPNLNIFTTRVDTIFGVTYVVVAPEHEIIGKLKDYIKNFSEIEDYASAAMQKTEIERTTENKEKTGVRLEGIEVTNPVNGRSLPVYVADYVLVEYGTGAVMSVPAHDARDFSFAKKYNLPVEKVINPEGNNDVALPFVDDGVLVNSGEFSGVSSQDARERIVKVLSKKSAASQIIYYKLRDWLISRQRYWGAPIPIIYCQKCGEVPVDEKDLPVLLPKLEDFKPSLDGKSPLSKSEKFVNVRCPKCGGKAHRETDTMDTFVCSSWYYLRYTDSRNAKEFAARKKINKWLPVNLYVGGAEHAVMHLLYARFFTKVLYDLGYVSFKEPFKKLYNQGIIYYKGAKMSKSKGNVVNPDELIGKYGADTARLYELFMGPADQATEWSDEGILGCFRFVNRIEALYKKVSSKASVSNNLLADLNKTIKKVDENIENFRFNVAVSQLMVFLSAMEQEQAVPKDIFITFLKLLSPIAPHICEELYQKLTAKKGKKFSSIFSQKWPKFDASLIKEQKVTIVIQVNSKVRDRIEASFDASQEEIEQKAREREIVKKWIQGKEITKVIFVKNRIINFVTK